MALCETQKFNGILAKPFLRMAKSQISPLSYLSYPDLNPISSCSSSQVRMREATERASMAWLGRPPIPAEAFLDFPPCAWMNCRWFSHVVGAAS